MEATSLPAPPTLIGRSPAFLAVMNRLPLLARLQRTTLVLGPTGSGKDLIARVLHDSSPRCGRPFVAVNCGALPDNLLESELFGHSAGAFTGATRERSGLVRTAATGTLFLDEIDSLSFAAQSKFLRFLEGGEYRAVGSDRVERSASWVIAASNRDLRERVRAGAFREDLLFRLEVVKLQIPSLRQRGGDVLTLADYFLAETKVEPSKQFTPDAERALIRHAWPGNVRELKHRIESASLLTEGPMIDAAALGLAELLDEPVPRPADEAGPWDLPRPTAADPLVAALRVEAPRSENPLERALWELMRDKSFTLQQATAACEKALISAALRAEGNNRTRAAARLGINVRTIYKKMVR